MGWIQSRKVGSGKSKCCVFPPFLQPLPQMRWSWLQNEAKASVHIPTRLVQELIRAHLAPVNSFYMAWEHSRGSQPAQTVSRGQRWHLVSCTIHPQRIDKLLPWIIFLCLLSSLDPIRALCEQLPARIMCNKYNAHQWHHCCTTGLSYTDLNRRVCEAFFCISGFYY